MTERLLSPDDRLSRQERQVVELFLKTLNPREVAIQLDMSLEAVADVLKRMDVRTSLGLHLLSEQRDRARAVRDGVILMLWQLGTHDIKDLFDDEGNVLPVHQMPPQLRHSIKGYKTGRYGPEFQFVDKSAILQSLLQQLTKLDLDKEDQGEERVVLEYPALDTTAEEVK